jgi:molybdate transport system regulatory protein
MGKLKAKLRVWIEDAQGVSVIGDGRARLLEKIGQTGSLSKAAKALSMSYRKAWEHLNMMEDGFGKKLVIRHVGGKQGGGTELTDAGKDILERYERLREELDKARDECFKGFMRK